MARKVLVDTQYTFNPTTRVITMPRAIPRERILLITNVTTNQVIYNFSDATLKFTAYQITQNTLANNATTSVTLSYNTGSMSATDKLQIVIDEENESFEPSETLTDPVGKLRVSQPQALIDTDFEYGLQPTKWETLTLLNNRPSLYVSTQAPITITNVTATNGSAAVVVSTTTPPAIGTPVLIQDSTFAGGNGPFVVDSVVAGTSFTYTARYPFTGTTGTIYNSTLTAAFSGSFYTGAAYSLSTQPTYSGQVVTVSTNEPHGLNVGDGIYITGATASTNPPNGSWTVAAIPTTTSFQVVVTNTPTGTIASATVYPRPDGVYIHRAFDGGVQFTTANPAHNLQTIRQTRRYFRYQSGKGIQISTGTILKPQVNIDEISSSGTTVTVTCKLPHQLTPGVSAIPTTTSFQVVVTNTPTGTIASATVYPRPDGVYIHRAFDGGVQFTTANPAHNLQTIRQTRRYFRYQSGKGIQISTGTILKPQVNIDEISSSGTTVTVTCKLPHQLTPGVSVIVSGAVETAYNGTFSVASVIDAFKFTYTAGSTPSATPASGVLTLSVANWYGAGTRIGMFDSQNGFYFEYDGQNLYAVRRKTTDQISGYVNVTNNSATVSGATVNGVTTKFSKQLTPGDFISIRGMTYRVMNITSDTAMTISPPYRGGTLSGGNVAVVTKTVEDRIPQSSFNMDRCDGTGPSGVNLDLAKMQMFFIDYSWYGAGTIRFGFRDVRGKIVYVHRFVNNNINTEAYMRSGNLPARYETHTFAPQTLLGSSMLVGDTTMTVANTSAFPSSGTILIADPSGVNGHEYVYYTGKTSTSFTGLTRGKTSTTVASCTTTSGSAAVTTTNSVAGLQPGMLVYGTGIPTGTFIYSITTGGTNTILLTQAATATGTVTLSFNQMASAAAGHTYSATAPVAVYLHAPQFAPTISHWGTSVIMDGRYDDDKSLIFTYGQTSSVSVAAGGQTALMSIRVAPSADSGITSFLGQKEIINRMQLKLVSLGVLTNGAFLVTVVLNASLSSGGGTVGTFGPFAVGTSSLAQIAAHTGAITVSGGEVVYGQFAVNSAGSTNQSTETLDLSGIRDLGNSILGGATSNVATSGFYPDGPDVVTIVVRNVGASSASIQGRLSWTEAQA